MPPALEFKASGTNLCIKQPAGGPQSSCSAVSSWLLFSKNPVNPCPESTTSSFPLRSVKPSRGKSAWLCLLPPSCKAQRPETPIAGCGPSRDAQTRLKSGTFSTSRLHSHQTQSHWPSHSVTSPEGVDKSLLPTSSPSGGSLSQNSRGLSAGWQATRRDLRRRREKDWGVSKNAPVGSGPPPEGIFLFQAHQPQLCRVGP